MIIETTINLKNKNKEELILLLNESLGVIEKQQRRIEKLDNDNTEWRAKYVIQLAKTDDLQKALNQSIEKINKIKNELKEVQEDFLDYCPDCVDLAEHIIKILEE